MNEIARDESDDAAARLDRLAVVAGELGLCDVASDARTFAERVAGGRFFVACVGQFKRGKSMLLNTLIGETLLPVGVVPVTSVVTVVRHGARRSVRVRRGAGAWQEIRTSELADYVAEAGNPQNTKGITAVEVFVPSPLLASGMCLADTPGIGSVLTGNTAATRAFLPQVDAALVVIGADPPISADELALIEDVAEHVSHLIVVLNKADRLSDAERAEAVDFARRVLAGRLRGPVGRILEVSATERSAGTGKPRDWPALVERLESLARESGATLVRAAEERGLEVLGARVLREMDERRGALLRPIEESEERVGALRKCAADAERSMRDLGYLLAAEQECLARAFQERREQFLARVLPRALDKLRREVRQLRTGRRSALREQAFRLAQGIFRDTVDRWQIREQPAAEQLYRAGMQRFVELANGFLERVAPSGGLAGQETPRVLVGEAGFRTRSRLYYTELLGLTGRSPIGWLTDRLRSRQGLIEALERNATGYLERIIITNAARVTHDLEDQVSESRRRLEAELRAQLREVYAAAERALERARARRAQGAEAIRADLERLEVLRSAVKAGLKPTRG